MHDIEFTKSARQLISFIAETIELEDKECLIDIDFNDDILSLITSEGTFVINKQGVAQEIWLSSPISGPYHFAKKGDRWLSRNNIDLFLLLTEELKIQIEPK